MSALAIGAIVFACVFGGALFGMFLGTILPKEHLSPDARDVIKVSMAMIATLAALVLGLLTASAKSSLDDKESELRSAAAQVVLLDRTMAEYGAETQGARDLLKQIVTARISQIWPDEKAKLTPGAIGRGARMEAIQRKLLDLSPQTDAQRWLQSTEISGAIAAARWSLLEQIGSSIQWPFMAILVLWLAIILRASACSPRATLV
ncbi:MAG: DUF4239 domain-containing protein [Methyloceanibacter sp.]|jgi:hypothetical protein